MSVLIDKFVLLLFILPLLSRESGTMPVIACYNCTRTRQKFSGAILIVASVPFFMDRPFFLRIDLMLSLLLSLFLAVRTQKLEKMREEFKKLRDDSMELNLLLNKKNQYLMEKQETEVHLATLKERNRIAREIHDNVGHMLSRSILQLGALKALNHDSSLSAPLSEYGHGQHTHQRARASGVICESS